MLQESLSRSITAHVIRNENWEWPNVCKDSHPIHRTDDGIYLRMRLSNHCQERGDAGLKSYSLALEWPPYHGPIVDGVFCYGAARYHPAFGDVIGIHYADDIILPGARALDILEKSVGEVLFDSWSEERRMQCDDSLELIEEKHDVLQAQCGTLNAPGQFVSRAAGH